MIKTTWACGSREVGAHREGDHSIKWKAWWQGRGWELGAGILTMGMKETEQTGSDEKIFISKPAPGDILLPAKLSHPVLSKQCHLLSVQMPETMEGTSLES